MNERIDTYLDGDLQLAELTPDEASQATGVAEQIDRVAARYRETRSPDLTVRIMASLPADLYATASPRAPAAHRASWLWRPRTISVNVRPGVAFGLLAAAVIAFVMLPFRQPPPAPPPRAATVVEQSQLYVQFRLDAPSASNVRLAGSFTGWQPTVELSETAPGVWSAMVPLAPGVHDYTFLVDGDEWVVDPNAPNVEDSFGGMNSRLFLAAPLGAA